MTAITYRFALQRNQVISANDRLHFHEEAKRAKALKQLGRSKAFNHGCQLGAPVVLSVHVGWPDARRRDRLNLSPTTKALVDGIAPYLLGDDNDDLIAGEYWASEVTRAGHIELALTFAETASRFCPVCHHQPKEAS